MSDVGFYDDNWQRLLRKYPSVAKKIEELRCETATYEELEELRVRVTELERTLQVRTNRLKRRWET